MKRIILFNGPPRSGKNTAATFLKLAYPMATDIIGVSHYLKRITHAIHLGRDAWDLDPDIFDSIKNEPQDVLSGKSWREMYIYVSEEFIKPLHGKAWLGERFLDTVKKSPESIIGVPDSGFRTELEPVVAEYKPENVLLLRVHKTNTNFKGDSRGYISMRDLGVKEFDIENIQDHPAFMRTELYMILKKWIS